VGVLSSNRSFIKNSNKFSGYWPPIGSNYIKSFAATATAPTQRLSAM